MTVLRFAPSPNGELHLGHAYSAQLNADIARRLGGRMLLRIEDIDTARCSPEYEAGIYRDLEWLGVRWEEPVRRQSQHFLDYRAALDRLKAMDVVYPAFLSRGEVRGWIADFESTGQAWPRDPDGAPHYPPLDRALSDAARRKRIASGERCSWRLNIDAALNALRKDHLPPPLTPPLTREGGVTVSESLSPLRGGVRGRGQSKTPTQREASLGWSELDPVTNAVSLIEANPRQWGDVILARSEAPTSYHLSVAIDDALQGVTHIVRGKDLYEATSVHRLLQELLGLTAPIYHHHPLILDADGRKLSKSERSTGLRTLREAGCTPSDIRAMVGLPT